MIISVMRDRTVSAFAVTVDELVELYNALCKEFPDEELTHISIEISEGDIDYEFSSFEDLRNNYKFERSVTDFRLTIQSTQRSIEIGQPLLRFTGIQAKVSAQSDSAAWCDGVISLASDYLKKKRVWYHVILKTRFVMYMFIVTSLAVAYGYSKYIPPEFNLEFLAVPVGVICGLILLSLRPKKMAATTLHIYGKHSDFPTIPILQLVISIFLLITSVYSIILEIGSM